MEEVILKERELRENIVQAINKANLPAFIIKPILSDCLIQISTLEQQQYEQAILNKEKEEVKEEVKDDKLGK